MAGLSQEHISFIIRDLHRRGVVLDGFEEEVIDHVCSAVESELIKGRNFKEAYDEVIKSFGNIDGLQNTQAQVVRARNRNTMSMLKNYFLVGIRNHIRQRFYTLINVAGLAVGLASFFVIALYV